MNNSLNVSRNNYIKITERLKIYAHIYIYTVFGALGALKLLQTF